MMIKWRDTRLAEDVARMGDRSANRVLMGNPERKRLLCRTRHSWEYDIEMDLRETG
jgi:hypothetical protein